MEQSSKVIDVQLPSTAKPSSKWKIKLGLPNYLKVSLLIIFFILFVGAVAGLAWSYWSYQKAQEQVVRLTSAEGRREFDQQQIAGLLDRVRKHIVLPEDEEPTVATIIDVEKLIEDQPFFQNAHNGDKVIVYPKAKTAIIYDPNRDVIVKVGAVVVSDNQQSGEGQPAAEEGQTAGEETTVEEEPTTQEEPATQEQQTP